MLSKVINMLEGIRNNRKKVYLAIFIAAVAICAVGAGVSFWAFGLLTIARDFLYVLPFLLGAPSLFVGAASNKRVINGARKWEAVLTARRAAGGPSTTRVGPLPTTPPETHETHETHETSETPETPETHETSETPETPETPETHETSETPAKTPGTSGRVVVEIGSFFRRGGKKLGGK